MFLFIASYFCFMNTINTIAFVITVRVSTLLFFSCILVTSTLVYLFLFQSSLLSFSPRYLKIMYLKVHDYEWQEVGSEMRIESSEHPSGDWQTSTSLEGDLGNYYENLDVIVFASLFSGKANFPETDCPVSCQKRSLVAHVLGAK